MLQGEGFLGCDFSSRRGFEDQCTSADRLWASRYGRLVVKTVPALHEHLGFSKSKARKLNRRDMMLLCECKGRRL